LQIIITTLTNSYASNPTILYQKKEDTKNQKMKKSLTRGENR
jgi:hypothetical protein